MASSTPTQPQKASDASNCSFFIVTITVIAVVLIVTNVLAFCCFTSCRPLEALRRFLRACGLLPGLDGDANPRTIPVCKYRREEGLEQGSESECSVCLSVFVDGEDIRQLPECKHSFHAPCIDMWLFSHTSCPLCRATVSALLDSGEGQPPVEPGTMGAVVVVSD